MVGERGSDTARAWRTRQLAVQGRRAELHPSEGVVGPHEARSCERFASLAPQLDSELQRFYRGLLKSEARHFKDYLQLAQRYSDEDIADRVASFAEREAELIEAPDKLFRFHSGIPA